MGSIASRSKVQLPVAFNVQLLRVQLPMAFKGSIASRLRVQLPAAFNSFSFRSNVSGILNY